MLRKRAITRLDANRAAALGLPPAYLLVPWISASRSFTFDTTASTSRDTHAPRSSRVGYLADFLEESGENVPRPELLDLHVGLAQEITHALFPTYWRGDLPNQELLHLTVR